MRRAACIVALLVLAGCGGSPTFSLSDASVDASYPCPANARNAPYEVHATISAHNPTSKAVTITSVSAVMTVSAVQGTWLQRVGDRYDAGSLSFAPSSVGAGSTATLEVTIPSSCTHGSTATGTNYGEYAVSFKVGTTAGTFEISSTNKHRILA